MQQASRQDPRKGAAQSRHSNGLEQFFLQFGASQDMRILDLAGASQANINFITGLGHGIFTEDLLQSLEDAFGDGDYQANQSDPERVAAFVEASLNFQPSQFDGVLLWDSLEYLAPPLLPIVADRLWSILRPGGYLLALFRAEERAEPVPSYSFRIADASSLVLTPREIRHPLHFFNNRAVEKLFHSFQSVKFFLARDHLREVIVKR